MIKYLKEYKRIFFLLFSCKFVFTSPKKKDFLIIDGKRKELIFNYIDENRCNILHTRGEYLNLYILLLSLFTLNFKSFHLNYINTYIKVSKPKCCITLNHPKIYFYKLKKFHKNLVTLSFQHGHTFLNDKNIFFRNLKREKKNNLSADYIFVHNKYFGEKLFNEFINTNLVYSGSFKNNYYFKKNDNQNKSKTICFISQFRMPENIKNMGFSYDQFYITEKKILPKLFEFAKKNNYNFEILGAEWNPDEEKNFFNDILNDHNWKFHERTKSNLSYFKTDCSELNVFVDSNLGFESLARGNKTISFNFRGQAHSMYHKFGFNFLEDKGNFWTNIDSDNEFNRLINYAENTNIEKWNKENSSIIKQMMEYDPANKKFQQIISTI